MRACVTAGAGFLLAVLWFDLMFDVQVLRHRRAARVPDDVLDSIAAYYRRVTTDARPMNRLVALFMLATLGAILAQVVAGTEPRWLGGGSLVLAGAPIALAAVHTVPKAVRLGAQSDPRPRQSEMARAICRDHLFCISAIALVLLAQVAAR